MKRYITQIFILVLIFAACSSSKKTTDKTNNTSKIEINDQLAKQSKDLYGKGLPNAKETAKLQKQKRKEELKRQKQLEKESKAKKKAEAKAKKQKEKEQERLIKNAAKEERKQIEADREKERQALVNSIKANKDIIAQENEQYEDQLQEPIKHHLVDTASTISLDSLIGDNISDTSFVKYSEQEEDNSSNVPSFLKGHKKNNKTSDKQTTEEILSDKNASTMDKVLAMMEQKQQSSQAMDSTAQDSVKYFAPEEEKNEGFVKKTWEKVFPKKEDRIVAYDKIYAEEPRSILILYPWNRSEYSNADEMLLIAATKELTTKGYYIPSTIAMMRQHEKDSTFSSQYKRIKDVKQLGEEYGVDAVMFVTIYRFDSPYWSTSTKANAHYLLISTKTLDTLFARQVDFNYDTPLPPKQNHNPEMELDDQQVYDLGVMEQMQSYGLTDMPFGPYHKKYRKDKKRSANKEEVKYKITVRPS